MSTVAELAAAIAPRAYTLLNQFDAAAVARSLELVLLERGFANEAAIPTDAEKANVVWRVAYQFVLAALDLARTKVEQAKAGPTEAKFRKEVEYLEALLVRLSKRAGIDEDCGCDVSPPSQATTFLVGKVPFFC